MKRRRALNDAEPRLPSYRAAAAVLERRPGGIPAEIAWTAARAVIVVPGFLVVGVRGWKVVWGALLSSAMITGVVLVRIYGARKRGLGLKPTRPPASHRTPSAVSRTRVARSGGSARG